jgi:Reverse transcriptase (RNA-dependent DNA polymerase)
MDQPEGFIKPGQEDKVCRLWKALYGLKQAPRQWYKRLCESMRNWGFSEHIPGDVATFLKISDDGSILIIVVYVDDLSIFASSTLLVNDFKKQVRTEYEYVDTGEIQHILGSINNIILRKLSNGLISNFHLP